MQNPDFSIFTDNMFQKTRSLIDGITPFDGLTEINMSIGEPQQDPPYFISKMLSQNSCNWVGYPKVKGDPKFYDNIKFYLNTRFSKIGDWLNPLDNYLLPVPGTREPLHMLGYCVRGTKPNPIALVTNPFYHAWRAAGLISGSKIKMMDACVENGCLPNLTKIDEFTLSNTTVMYLCSPTNPHGAIATEDYLKRALMLARKYDFLLVVDECYIDVWRDEMPSSILEIARKFSQNDDKKLANLAVLNSLSKRSNAAGLRAGFLCADAGIISSYSQLAANGLALVPSPILDISGEIYRDTEHNKAVREHYNNAFKLAQKYLNCSIPKAGFFLWLYVGDDLKFTQLLWKHVAIKVIPGSYMAVSNKGKNPASGYIRIALVHQLDVIEEAMKRFQVFFQNIWQEHENNE